MSMTDAECRERLTDLRAHCLTRAGDPSVYAPAYLLDADALAHALERLALLDDALAVVRDVRDELYRSGLASGGDGLTVSLDTDDARLLDAARAVLDRAGKEA
jgi:hypothetical protein